MKILHKIIIIIFLGSCLFSQELDSLYVQATHLYNTPGDESNKQAVIILTDILAKDNSFIEAHYLLFLIFANNFSDIYSIDAALYYAEECIQLLEQGFDVRGLDEVTKRKIYASIANSYRDFRGFNSKSEIELFKKAILYYRRALESPPNLKPGERNLFPDARLKALIAECYVKVADRHKYEKKYGLALANLDIAKDLYEQSLYTNKVNEVEEKIDVLNLLSEFSRWTPFMAEMKKNSFAQPEIIEITSMSGEFYFYNETDLTTIDSNILRVWLLSVKPNRDSLDINDVYTSKWLVQFNFSEGMYSHLQLVSYNKNDELIENFTAETPGWENIIPDTIYEYIFTYLKNKYYTE